MFFSLKENTLLFFRQGNKSVFSGTKETQLALLALCGHKGWSQTSFPVSDNDRLISQLFPRCISDLVE